MLNRLKLRQKFSVILVSIFLASLPIMAVSSYFILLKNAEQEIFETAQVFLAAMESVRKHVSTVSRPAVMHELRDSNRFIVAAESSSYFARGVAEKVREQFPHYIFRHISLNPRHPQNRADAFESDVLAKFTKDRSTQIHHGFVKRPDGEYFFVARPITSKADCLRCHSTPDIAPRELVEHYGKTAAFGWKSNELVAALVTYVPTSIAKKNAIKAVAVFTGFYIVVFSAILIIVDRLIAASIIRPITHFVETAHEISSGNMDKHFEVSGNDEIRTLADAFTRMKRSLEKAMELISRR